MCNAGSGVDLSIDAMASGPYGLLLSNVDVGYGSRFWGPQVLSTTDVASYMTAWNVKSQVKVSWHCIRDSVQQCVCNRNAALAMVAGSGVCRCITTAWNVKSQVKVSWHCVSDNVFLT
jgi:hypothetical protein